VSRRTWPPAEYFTEACSPLERSKVLRLIAEGHSNRDIGDQLSVSEDTVKVHVRHIMLKLAANDRTEAAVIGMRRGFIKLSVL